MNIQEDQHKILVDKLHLLYLDNQDGNLHEALASFLKKLGISNPDKDPRIAQPEKEQLDSEKQEEKLKKAYQADNTSLMVYVEFDNLGYFQDPLDIKCVKIYAKTITGIVKTHESVYKKISLNTKFYISNHMQTTAIASPKSYILDSMAIWEKTRIHKNYQEFDYNFDYDFGDL